MGICAVKKNRKANNPDLDRYKTKVLDHEPTSRGMQSKKEEIDQKNNCTPQNFNEKILRAMLQKMISQKQIERQNIFNVKDNVEENVESLTLIFMVDTVILSKKNNLVSSMIYNIIKDFEEHFSKLNGKPLLSIISILLLSYSSKKISEVKSISLLDQDNIMKDLEGLAMFDLSAGEIGALNSLAKMSFQIPGYLFHFCGEEFEDETLYEVELETGLREIIHNYEMIVLEKSNLRLQGKAESLFSKFTTTMLTLNA